ncbi:MAG: precorrin-3B C(17)-methyltransferase [Rhodospirillales bacterium]|nr:MAG: precorrin-3B C(17)-methyltransferase [Rhodospirillales bacterium]
MILARRHADDAGRWVRPAVAAGLPAAAAIVALSPGGADTARRIRAILPASTVHGLDPRVDGADVAFTDAMDHLRVLFRTGTPLVGVCAAGILIRALAPLLGDKRREPPVVAVAEDLSVAVPLLGGHHGGNAIARAIADAFGATPAVTTGGDVRLGLALDDPPPGWTVANPEAAKAVSAALLASRPVGLRVEAGDPGWLRASGAGWDEAGRPEVLVTDRAVPTPQGLVLHPPVLAVGVGCERGCDPAELEALVVQTLERHGLAPGAVACVASIDLKADEAAVHAVAGSLGAPPARFFTADALEAEAPRLWNPSEVVFREVGCHGVAEGAALAAAGADGALVVGKSRSRRATCAVARAAAAIDPGRTGQARGSLAVVGIGPGGPAWRSPEASRALAEATDIVGYRLYLDLIADAIAGKRRHDFAMTQEEPRTRAALDLAAEGRAVALVSSGDAGIYGLAALVFELLDREDRPAWNRLAIRVVPGISALQLAAARVGAPTGHDFAAISLSDLLTPWADIERRLEAVAAGDFVVALYNPVSRRRRTQLVAARDILLRHRPAETPVALVRNAGRDGEAVTVVPLSRLEPDLADMLTVVLIGNSHTRRIRRGQAEWVYTPRGYAGKAGRGHR